MDMRVKESHPKTPSMLNAHAPEIHHSEQQLSRDARGTLAKLRTGMYTLLQEYL